MYAVFTQDHVPNEENIEAFGEAVKNSLITSIKKASEKRIPTLRMSVIGKPDRQLWFDLNPEDNTQVVELEDLDLYEPNPEKYLKFLFGDILEQLLMFLVKESGHKLTHDQEEVSCNGVTGHTDGVIDGVVIDFKTASNYSFEHKFRQGKLLRGEDPFGYIGQISGYHHELQKKYPDEINKDRAAWLTMNKETGQLNLLVADAVFDLIDAEQRVEEVKKIVSSPIPPVNKCYPDEEFGKSGNKVISKSCSFCPHKERCWSSSNDGKGLRKFQYSNGVVYFTDVVNTPRVEEIV